MRPLSAPQVRAIRALADTRRLSEAAARLNLSPSALSRHIAGAEARLGLPLFRRGWSGVEATGAGDAVARRCQRILARLEALDAGPLAEGGRPSRLASHARWRHLRAVAETLRCGSVSGAAAAMGLSQPAVSQALAEAAAHVAPPLFQRRREGLAPLPAAHLVAAAWAAIAADLAALPLNLDPGGRVAVGMLPFSGQALVIETFAALTQTHPGLQLVAIPGSYATLGQSLIRGEIDLFVGTLRRPSPQPAFAEEALYEETYTMIARADHPCHAGPRDRAALARLRWSVAPHGTPVRRWFEAFFADCAPPPQTQPCEFFSFANAEQMILHSESVGLLSYAPEALRALPAGLRALDVALPEAAVPIGVTTLAGQPPSPAAAAFLEALRARVAARISPASCAG